jgi:hypothetical protein
VTNRTEVIATDACYERLQVYGTGQVILEPGVRLYLKGTGIDSSYVLDLAGGSIVARGRNEIYGGPGRISTQSYTGFLNQSDPINPRPKELMMRFEGSDPSGINYLRQEAPFYGVVYMRRGLLYVKGYKPPFVPYTDGEFFGGVISGDRLIVAAHDAGTRTDFHHDTSLTYEGIVGVAPTSSSGITIKLWQQVQ